MTEPADIVERQLAAYNAHDLDAFAATYADDVRISRANGGEIRGRTQLREVYARLFAQRRYKAEVVGRLAEGDWVVDHEITHGADTSVRVLVAYRVRDGLIDRVDFLS
ncbi:nuclear transport factor 2 family protein [Nonomuraea sp. KM90]|uniref:nuclear transport factor 2 family protein n=1 Tax=Nonomuraea sp. KM90 TaxID=3457428 RepID=UPI003FCE8A18